MYEQQNDAECNSYSDGKVVMNEDEAELCQCCIRIHRQSEDAMQRNVEKERDKKVKWKQENVREEGT